MVNSSEADSQNSTADSHNRKMKGVVGESSNRPARLSDKQIDYSAPPGVPHAPLFQSLGASRAQHAPDSAFDRRPFFHQRSLNGSVPEGYLRSPYNLENRDVSEPIGQIIDSHGENLKKELSDMVKTLAEAKVANILKMKEQLLKQKLNQNDYLVTDTLIYKEQADYLMDEVQSMEQTANSLRKTIKEANARMNANTIKENPEKYLVDPVRLGPVWLDCKACGKNVATVMMLPCRHISVCTQCQNVTLACPICSQTMVDNVEVHLPYK